MARVSNTTTRVGAWHSLENHCDPLEFDRGLTPGTIIRAAVSRVTLARLRFTRNFLVVRASGTEVHTRLVSEKCAREDPPALESFVVIIGT